MKGFLTTANKLIHVLHQNIQRKTFSHRHWHCIEHLPCLNHGLNRTALSPSLSFTNTQTHSEVFTESSLHTTSLSPLVQQLCIIETTVASLLGHTTPETVHTSTCSMNSDRTKPHSASSCKQAGLCHSGQNTLKSNLTFRRAVGIEAVGLQQCGQRTGISTPLNIFWSSLSPRPAEPPGLFFYEPLHVLAWKWIFQRFCHVPTTLPVTCNLYPVTGYTQLQSMDITYQQQVTTVGPMDNAAESRLVHPHRSSYLHWQDSQST